MLLGLLAATWLLYQPGLQGPFLLDDQANIAPTRVAAVDVEHLAPVALSGERFLGLSRSVARMSFALTQFYSGEAPYAFKYQNLLLHLINALLVFWLVLLLGQLRGANAGKDCPPALWSALAVTAIWALHPLQVSTVLYAVQRLVLLASLFMLAGLIAYTKGRLLSATRPRLAVILTVGAFALLGGLGLLSKETAVLLPLLILLVELFFFRLSFQQTTQRRIWSALLILIALPLLVGGTYVLLHLDGFLAWHPGRGFSGIERLWTQVHVVGLYLKLFFVPVPGTMSLFHDGFPITRSLDAETLALALGWSGMLIVGLLLRRRATWIGFGILFFFSCHLLESTVIALEMVFEHRNYLAILGLAMATVAGGLRLFEPAPALRRLSAPVLAVILIILGMNTAIRAHSWGDLERMLATDYRHRPTSVRVLSGLVSLASSRGNQQAASRYLSELLALDIADAGPELGALLLFCRHRSMPEGLHQRALDKLAGGRLTPFAISGLRRLVDAHLTERCPATGSEQLSAMVRAALANRRPYGSDQHCQSAEIHLRLLLDQQDWPAARRAWDKALGLCAGSKPKNIRLAIENPLRFADDRRLWADTVALARSVTADPRHQPMLDRGYAGQGGFDLDALIGIAGSER